MTIGMYSLKYVQKAKKAPCYTSYRHRSLLIKELTER